MINNLDLIAVFRWLLKILYLNTLINYVTFREKYGGIINTVVLLNL